MIDRTFLTRKLTFSPYWILTLLRKTSTVRAGIQYKHKWQLDQR